MKKTTLLLLFLTLFIYKTYSQVPQEEFEALVALYKSTDGDNWNNNTGWDINATADDVTDEWFGISIRNGRVRKIDLQGNNLVGKLPSEIEKLNMLLELWLEKNSITYLPFEIGKLANLKTLALSNNDIKEIPGEIGNLYLLSYLSLGSNQIVNCPEEIKKLSNLSVLVLNENNIKSIPDFSGFHKLGYKFLINDNCLDFGDLENARVNWSNIYIKSYAPQALVPIEKHERTDKLVLRVLESGSNSQYQWYKNDELLINETNDSIVINNEDEAGVYNCQITDLNFPELILVSDNYKVEAKISKKEFAALKAIYESTNGEQWINNSNWLSDLPVNEWYGVSVVNKKVIFLDLSNNNLSGKLPSEIGDLVNLQMLNLANSNLEGAIPESIGNLKLLTNLNLADNGLTGDIPEEIKNLINLNELLLVNNKLSSLPNLSALQNLEILSIEGNKLDFGDIEPNIGLSQSGFTYSPQDTIGLKEDKYSDVGTVLNLIVQVGGDNNVYQWYKDGNAIPDSDNDTLTIAEFNSSNSGLYTCKVTNTRATALIMLSNPYHAMVTGFNEIRQLQGKIFPNPSTGKFTLSMEKLPSKNCMINIFSLEGKKVYQQKLERAETSVELSEIQEGVYLLHVNDGEKVYGSVKLLIKRK